MAPAPSNIPSDLSGESRYLERVGDTRIPSLQGRGRKAARAPGLVESPRPKNLHGEDYYGAADSSYRYAARSYIGCEVYFAFFYF